MLESQVGTSWNITNWYIDMKKILIIILLTTYSLSGCKKTTQNPPTPPITRDDFTKNNWQVHEVLTNKVTGFVGFNDYVISFLPVSSSPDSVWIYNFSDWGTGEVEAAVSNSTLTIPDQTVGSGSNLFIISGSGTLSSDHKLSYSYDGLNNNGGSWKSQCNGVIK